MDIATVDRFVEDQRDKHRIPGMMLALFEDGEVVYTKGDGAADSARPMSVEVAMPVGSVTRSFTAVLQLVERGQVTLDAPVRTYLSWFQVADDAASEAITVRHLLNHTSGLSDLGYNRVMPADTFLEDGVRDPRRARLTAPVGTKHEYFNPMSSSSGSRWRQIPLSASSYRRGPSRSLSSCRERTTMARIKKSKSVRRWNDLSPGQQTVLLTRRSPSSLAVTAWTDLAFRPAAQVNNRKALWAAIIAINFAGPVLYFWRGIDR